MRCISLKLWAAMPLAGLSSSELILSGVDARSLANALTRSGMRNTGGTDEELSKPREGVSPIWVSEMLRECLECPAIADGARCLFGSAGAESLRIPGRVTDIDRDDRTEPLSSAKPTLGRVGPEVWAP